MVLTRLHLRVLALVAVFAALVTYCVGLSESGLWDPWETHYTEVARTILVRHDPLDLRWRPGVGPDGRYETLFRSKHVLPFWIIALSLRVYGVGTNGADDELIGSHAIEWAARTPSILLGFLAAFFLGWVARKHTNPRVGWLTTACLLSLPHYALVSRQALTDIYLLASIVVGVGCWAMSWLQDASQQPEQVYAFGRVYIYFSKKRLLFFGALMLCTALPLAVLHLHVSHPATVAMVKGWQAQASAPHLEDLEQIRRVFAGYWAALVIAAASIFVGAKTPPNCWRALAYTFAGIAFMAKGILGFGLVAAICGLDFLVNRGWAAFRSLAAVRGMLWVAVAAAPWHHAMAIYRGEGWVNELLFVNNLARFVEGEQEQAVGDLSYYLSAMAPALGPWLVVLPASIWMVMRQLAQAPRDQSDSGTREANWLKLVCIWLFVVLAVISASVTKYLHYLAPCMPPIACVLACAADAHLRSRDRLTYTTKAMLLATAVAIGVQVVASSREIPAGMVHLTTYLYTGEWQSGAVLQPFYELCCLFFLLAASVALLANQQKWQARALAAAFCCGWALVGYIFYDYLPHASKSWSQRDLIERYYQQRESGEQLQAIWFYHRGETLYTKGKVWVLNERKPATLREDLRKRQEKQTQAWMITSKKTVDRLRRVLPTNLRPLLQVELENDHDALLRLIFPVEKESSRPGANPAAKPDPTALTDDTATNLEDEPTTGANSQQEVEPS